MQMKRLLFLFLCMVFFLNRNVWSQSNSGNVCSGKVGFRVLQLYDRSRPAISSDPRVTARYMQVSLWYPAAKIDSSKQVTFRDLVELSSTELNPTKPEAASKQAAVDAFIQEVTKWGGASIQDVKSLMNRKTAAYWNIASRGGEFPALVFVHSTPPAEHLMAERLAECGFVVGAVVSKGTTARDYRLSVPDVETMVTDTMFVLAALRSLPFTHPHQAGIIGMSNGAFAGVLAHLRNPEISAVVSLDGTIGEQAANKVLPGDPYFDPTKIRAAILHLYTTENPYLTLEPIHSFIHAERTLVAMPQMRHFDFLAYGFYESIVPGLLGTPSADHSAGFEWVSRFTTQFFRAHLYGDESSRLLLENAVKHNPDQDWISSITSENAD